MHVNCTPTDSTRNCYRVLGKNSYSYTFGTISKNSRKTQPYPRAARKNEKKQRNNPKFLILLFSIPTRNRKVHSYSSQKLRKANRKD